MFQSPTEVGRGRVGSVMAHAVGMGWGLHWSLSGQVMSSASSHFHSQVHGVRTGCVGLMGATTVQCGPDSQETLGSQASSSMSIVLFS